MPADRLSLLDSSFLEVESPNAHMHVGWMASFAPPAEGPPPSFEALRAHIESRLCRAPRFRQRLAPVPFGVHEPEWVDAEDFDCSRHVRRASGRDLGEVADTVMSEPLSRDHPLWEMWLVPDLPEGRTGLVGKAHHCLVDGIAAVQMASVLLDPSPQTPQSPQPGDEDPWLPAPAAPATTRLVGGLLDRARDYAHLATSPARVGLSPDALASAVRQAGRAVGALASTMGLATPDPMLNRETSPRRHLAGVNRPLDDLRRVKRHFGTSLNDVLLAACAGGMRRFGQRRAQPPSRLKTMVPVNVRDEETDGMLGNRISFMFVDLPCDQPDPVQRLYDVHRATSEHKRSGHPEGAGTMIDALAHAPGPMQQLVLRMMGSERAFNLTISNVPGPTAPLYMLGCRLEEAYPAVPLADRHALSIGMHTSGGGAFLGLYADREALPDCDRLAQDIGEEIDGLVALTT